MNMRIVVCMLLFLGIVEAAEKCDSPIEIAAVIDASDNLSPSNLPEIKRFLKKVGNFFHVSAHASHMAVILAGKEVEVAIDLGKFGANRAKFPRAVETSVKVLGGDWNLDRGLKKVKDDVFTTENGVRNFLPRIVLLITNGKQGNGDRSSVLESRAKDLHDMGVQVYAVGVGDGVSRDELRFVVKNETEHLYVAESFQDLDSLSSKISNDICKRNDIGDLALCQTAADIGFIVDSSGSIGTQQYLNMKNFMKGITVAMGFKPSVTHIGIVLYSNRAELYTTFGEHANLRKLFRTLLKMPHHRDVTRIDLGLHIANTELFTTDNGMREDVKKVAILFTDGEQTTVGVNDLIPLEQAAGKLKERGIDIFAVGIGKKVKRQQLLKIASSPEYVIMLRSFAELQESVSKIAASTCQQVVGKPVVNFTQSVYSANEYEKAVVGIYVTQNEVISPVTVSIHPSPATADNDDFIATVQNVTFQPGETRKQIEIELVDDQRVEYIESFVLSLASSSSVILGEPSSVNIFDDDVVINFTKPVYHVREYEGAAKVEILVTDGLAYRPVTVSINTRRGTAGGQDFDGAVKDVTFQPGEFGPKSVDISLVDDRIVEPTETFTVFLSSNSGAVLGEPSAVKIEDDDVVINFTRPVYNMNEDYGKAKVGIAVTNGVIFRPVTVSITPRPGSAGYQDFDKTVKDVTFQPGESRSEFIEISLVDDRIIEPNETFSVILSSKSPSAILGEPSDVNIRDDDVAINFTQPVYNAKEDYGKASVGILVTEGVISTRPITVSITPEPGSASYQDFKGSFKDVTFQPGESGPKVVDIALVDDRKVEPTEKFTVSLSSKSPRAILGEPSDVIIQDDDVVIDFTKPVYNVKESDGKAKVGISVTGGAISRPVTVSIIPRPSSAGGQDFDDAVKNVTFQPGESGPKFVDIDLVDDRNVEPTETFTVSLSSKSRAVLGKPSDVNIQDDDVAIDFTQPIYNVKENDGTAQVGISVTDGVISEPTTVSITPRPSSAGGEDFDGTVKDVTFLPGEIGPKLVGIGLVDDRNVEPNETFTVSLSSKSPRAVLGEPSDVNIQDDDVVINFTQPVYNVNEDERNATVGILVTDGSVSEPVIVRVTPRLGTAGKEDFDATAKVVTFQPGETGPKFIEVGPIDDANDESTEKFSLSLSSNSRAILGKPSTVNIIDNDDPPPPLIEFTKPVYNASESGDAVVGVLVTDGEVVEPVTVRVTPNSDTASEEDFDSAAKDVTFQPGETGPKSVVIGIVDDSVDEPIEKFSVGLSSNSRAILGGPSSVNIQDNDDPPPPEIQFSQKVYNTSEDKDAIVGIFVAKGEVTKPVTVRIVPRSDTAGEADFDSKVKEVTFQPGETEQRYVRIGIVNDRDDEPAEKFTVSLTSDSPAILGGPSSVNILDDDVPPPPVIEFTEPVYNASEKGDVLVGVSVTDGEVTEPVTVSITPQPDTADKEDFDNAVQYVTFQPGEIGPKSVTVALVDDDVNEPTEKFVVSLSSDKPAVLGGPSSVYIEDDDVDPICGTSLDDCHEHGRCVDTRPGDYKCSCNPGYAGDGKFCTEIRVGFTERVYNVNEDAMTAEVELIVKSGAITTPVTIIVQPDRDSAEATDFKQEPVQVTFQPGEKGPKSASFDIFNDSEDEEVETFKVSLFSEDPVSLDEPAFVNIIDDDDPLPPVIKFTKPVYGAVEGGVAVVEISVTDGKVTEPVTVRITPNSDTAAAGDYDDSAKEVTFQPGETGPKLVRFELVDDTDDEPNENFTVSLSSNSPVNLQRKPSTVTIEDDDEPICKTFKHDCHPHAICTDLGPGLYNCTCQKGYSGDGKTCKVIAFSFTSSVFDAKENEKAAVEIQLASGEINKPVTIEVQPIKGTADEDDFSPETKYVTFQPGETENKVVEIDLIDDDVVESTENFTVRLSSLTFVAFGLPATVKIQDNDAIAEICDMDIGFLLDSTASMRGCNFNNEKEFVKGIAGYFQVASGATRLSTIVYGTDSVLSKKFNETKSLRDFQKEVDNLPLKGGRANLDKALHLAASDMFTVKNGMRPNVPKVLVVFNDGAQKVITQSAKEISSMLRKNEVRVIVIGIGEADRDLLSQIVASPEDLMMVEKFEDATENLVALLKRFCLKRDNNSCRILKKKVADLNIGGCISEKAVEIGVCGGYCSSFSNFVKRNGFYEMNCACCKAKEKVTITVDLKCSMNTYQAFNIRSAESCSCEPCETSRINVQ